MAVVAGLGIVGGIAKLVHDFRACRADLARPRNRWEKMCDDGQS